MTQLIVPDDFRGRFYRNAEAVFQAIHDQTITYAEALRALDLLASGKLELPNPVREFDDRLLHLEAQRRHLLQVAGDGVHLTPSAIEELRTLELPDPVQSLRSLAVLYRPRLTFKKTLWEWQGALWRSVADANWGFTELVHADQDRVWLSQGTYRHQEGWCIVYLDLLAGWRPYEALSVTDDDNSDREGHQAAAEVLAALALNPGLRELMDGRRLPHLLLAGIRLPQRATLSAPQSLRVVRAFPRQAHGADKRNRLEVQKVSSIKGFKGTAAPRILRVERLAA